MTRDKHLQGRRDGGGQGNATRKHEQIAAFQHNNPHNNQHSQIFRPRSMPKNGM
jgi:hypothetical protein